MLDIKEVIKGLQIERECVSHDCDRDCGKCDLVQERDWLLSVYDGALELLEEQEWISVRDRLPNCNGCYLVWRPHFYQDKGMPSICYFDGQNTWHDSYGVDFTRTLAPDDVSHWMPLPEQPCKAVKLE